LRTSAVKGYDAVILGAPGRLLLCRQMTAYFKQMQSVKGFPVAC
jgi:hypothetical protein